MPTAEHGHAGGPPPRQSAAPGARTGDAMTASAGSRVLIWCGLALVLAAALGLRLWGIKQGLPYVYNIDEAGHFVPKAVRMFSSGLDPRYFVNPPALTYVLHAVFAVWYGGGASVERVFALHPDQVYLLARVTVAILGAAAIWMLYLLGARLFDRRVGLLAAALEAVAFLPVFYGHFALNDAPTLLPLTLSLFGSAGVLRYGRGLDYAFAGIGLGLGCASKYTAGIVLVALVAAAAAHYLRGEPGGGRRVIVGISLAGGCALAAFLAANPYALLDFQRFHAELIHQSSLSEEAQGKLGAPKESGIVYYLWSLTWGLGWAPALAALGGAVAIWRHDQRIGWLLVPAPLLFLAFMGLQDRYFGRWLMPIFPIVCVLGAFFALLVARTLVARLPKGALSRAPALGAILVPALIAAGLLAQGAVYSVHNDLVLSRADTRNLTREWLLAHVPRGAGIVLEPVVPNAWIAQRGALAQSGPSADRWAKSAALRSVIAPDGRLAVGSMHSVALEDYETTLSPALIAWYERQGYCWVVSGSTESGRALADPRAAPYAVAYYGALEQQAQVALRVSPYAPGASPVPFSFDWTFDYYPLAYERPGPAMTVYRLQGGRCGRAVYPE